jgi:hypothetical protein
MSKNKFVDSFKEAIQDIFALDVIKLHKHLFIIYFKTLIGVNLPNKSGFIQFI